jgi:hypothetical protein
MREAAMPIQRLQGMLGTLWILDFVFLGLMIAPMNNGTPMLIGLGLWAVPTALLVLLTWRRFHGRGASTTHLDTHGPRQSTRRT